MTWDMHLQDAAWWGPFADRCQGAIFLLKYVLALVDKNVINYADVDEIFEQTRVRAPDPEAARKIPMYVPPQPQRLQVQRRSRRPAVMHLPPELEVSGSSPTGGHRDSRGSCGPEVRAAPAETIKVRATPTCAARRDAAPGPHAQGNAVRQVVDDLNAEGSGQQKP